MKLLDRIMILLLNLALLFSAILVPALALAESPAYYRRAFARTGLYERIGEDGMAYRTVTYFINGDPEVYALLSDEQLDEIALHIVSYVKGDVEAFELYMDRVYLNDGYANNVRIFGDTAISHMADVRVLVKAAEVAAAILCAMIPILLAYVIVRRRTVGRFVLRYTLVFYLALLSLAALFILLTALFNGGELPFVQALWRNIHYLFFPFQPEKVAGSFFDDALTYILRIDLFMGAVYTVLGILIAALSLFALLAVWLRRCARGK